MFLRKVRYAAAGLVALAALAASPNRSDAAVEVLIMEGSTTLFSGTVAANGQVTASSANYSTINLQFGNSASMVAASFSTSYTLTPSTSLDVANAPSLTVRVIDTGADGTGISALAGSGATLTNDVSVTNGILTSNGLGTVGLTATTSLLEFGTTNSLGSSGPDSATKPGSGSGSSTESIDSLTAKYSIMQEFTIGLSGTGSPLASTLTGGVSSTLEVNQAAVPAPPAALLAALALPVFGLRRVLRRKTTA